ncbi:iron permease FTR1 family-domain-containing protein [Zopfochytrium polystomum]|nr:iron permease FTR1 family-domain-containing protein [Zopfochytrium polystomum]
MVGFSVPIFFATFREATEASIVVSVLATFVHQTFAATPAIKKRLNTLVLIGTGIGLLISIIIGAAFLAVWFKYANNLWSSAENLWEASFSLLACILLTIMAIAFLETEDITAKWNRKLKKKLASHSKTERKGPTSFSPADNDSHSLASTSSEHSFMDSMFAKAKTYFKSKKTAGNGEAAPKEKASKEKDSEDISNSDVDKPARAAANALFLIPLITVLREGLEGMVFLGGLGISTDAGSIPIAAIVGIILGVLLGYVIYKAGNAVKLRTFFTSAATFLFFLAAGLLVKAVLMFQAYQWAKRLGAADADDIVGSFNPFVTMWYLDCCNPETKEDLGWQIFSAILGWSNQGTYASISSYISYWIVISIGLVIAKFMKAKAKKEKEARRASRKQRRAEAEAAVSVA